MDDDTTLDITRRRALAALGSVGIASAGAGLGTSAYFGDQETFANNRFAAGTLDMTVGWAETYSDWSADEGAGVSVRMYDGPDGTGDATDLRAGKTGLPADDENDAGGYALSLGDPGPGAVRFYSRGKDTVSLHTSTGVVDADSWHHVAGVYDDAAETRRLYVAGHLEATLQSDTGPWGTASGPATIGGEPDAGDESDRRFRGRIHDAHVYARPLGAREVGMLYDEG